MVKNRWAFALIGLCLVWRLTRLFLDFPIWGDEAMVAINFFDASYADLFQPLEYGQIGPLGWLWLEKLMFDIGGGSLFMLRLPSFVAGAVSVLVFWRVAQKVVEPRAALFSLAIFCASYYPMRYSIEVKPYAFDLLIALLLIESSLSSAPKKFFVVAALGIFFSLPSMFVVAGCGLYLYYNLSAQRNLLFIGGVLLIAEYTWMTISFTLPHAEAASWLHEMDMWVTAFPPISEWWTVPSWLIERHAGYMSAYPTGGRHFGSSATLLLQILGVLVLWRQQRKSQLALLYGSLPFLFIAAAIQAYPYGGSVRVAIFLAPAICICAAVGLERLLPSPRATAVVVIAMLLFITGGILKDINQPYKTISDQNCVQFVQLLETTVDENTTLVVDVAGVDEEQATNFLEHGGGLARLRYLLRRELNKDLVLPQSLASGNSDKNVVRIHYTDHDTVPTLR